VGNIFFLDLQKQIPSIPNITVRGTHHHDGYDIMALTNISDENEWDFYFRNNTAARYNPGLDGPFV
jgi:hypothetical protein